MLYKAVARSIRITPLQRNRILKAELHISIADTAVFALELKHGPDSLFKSYNAVRLRKHVYAVLDSTVLHPKLRHLYVQEELDTGTRGQYS